MKHWTAAPAVKAALAEATRRWPDRDRSADGTIGDVAHSSRTSDHNPDDRGVVLAFDLTCDLDAGCDAHALVRAAVARRDPRIKYAISQGHIWSKKRADEGWRTYTGSNPHRKHAHVSVDRAFEDDMSEWWPAAPTPLDPPPSLEEVAMRVIYAPGRPTCLLRGDGRLWPLASNAEVGAYEAAGLDVYTISPEQWDLLEGVSKAMAK